MCRINLIAPFVSVCTVFPFIERPAEETLKTALELLRRLRAIRQEAPGRWILDQQIGVPMARLPLAPQISRFLLEGVLTGQAVDEFITAAALLSTGGSVFRRVEKRSRWVSGAFYLFFRGK